MPLDLEVYRTLLESMPNGVYMVDRERRILVWNEAAEKLSGYPREEVVGRRCDWDLLVHCDDNNATLCGAACPLLGTMTDGKPRVADVFLRHKGGQRVPVRVRAIPIREPNGTIIGAAEVFDERVPLPATEDHPNSEAVHDMDDPRTGIPDEDSMRRHLEGWLLDFAESHIPFALVLIGVEGVDELRKTHGAGAAEAILRVTAQTVAGNLRPADVAGCWSQDRFAVILADCPARALPRVAGMLHRIVSGAGILWWGDRVSLPASIGASAVQEGDTAEAMVERAEVALATALGEGGNRVSTI